MNFIAIDFETANSKLSSPCSLGLVVVEEGKIRSKHHWYIRPVPFRFSSMNINIHGITPEMTKDAPTFNLLWPKLEPLFENNIIIAHNASFDMAVLRHTLDQFNISYPNSSYFCSMKLYQKMTPDSISYRLPMLSKSIGFEFKHHDALEDSLACSKLMINALEKSRCRSITELSRKYRVSLGKLYPGGYTPCSTSLAGLRSAPRKSKSMRDIKPDKNVPLTGDPKYFEGRRFALTGRFSSMSRNEALQQIVNHSGEVTDAITRSTDVLVVGERDFQNMHQGKVSSKLKKALEFQRQGGEIEIVSEKEFLKFMG
jgi:DNA polymerase III subunit epsilon